MLKLLLNYIHEYCDAPRPWGLYFQDSAAPQMEGLVELHDNIMFYLIIILFGVGWVLVSVITKLQQCKISNLTQILKPRYFNRISLNNYTCFNININSFPFF